MMVRKRIKVVRNNSSEFGVDTAKGGVIFTVASITRAIGTLLLLIILARLLQPTDYGLYAIVIALASLLGLSTDYGIGNALRKKLPESKTNVRKLDIINNAYFGVVFITIILALIVVIFSNYIAVNLYHNAIITQPIIVAAISLIFSALFAVTIAALLGIRKNKEAGIGYITYSVSNLVLSSVFVLLGYGVFGALVGMLIALIIAFLVTFGLLINHIKYSFIKPSKKIIKELFGFSTPIFASSALSNGTNNLGVIMLGIFASTTIVGNYGAALKLAGFGDVIIIACTQVLLPAYSHMISNKKLSSKTETVYNSSIYYSLLFLLPLLAYLAAGSRAFIDIFLGSTYKLAPLYFPIIATGIIAGIIYRYGGQMVIGYGKIKAYVTYVISVSIIVIVSLVILTPLLKVYGVLLSLFVIGPILFDLAFLRFMSKELNIKFHWQKILKVVIASFIIGLLLFYMSTIILQGRYLLLVNIAIIFILYPPLLVLFEGVNKEDISFIAIVSNKMKINIITKYVLAYTNFFIKIMGRS
jgi:O-antigen/teichoic acid export membrane protein